MIKQQAIPADEQLQKRKEELEKLLNKSQRNISNKWNSLFTPPKANNKVQHWVGQAEKAVAVYDGFMLMYKLFNKYGKVKQLFGKRKK